MEETQHTQQFVPAIADPNQITTSAHAPEAARHASETDEDNIHRYSPHREDIEFMSITLSGSREIVEFVAKVPGFPRFAASADGRVFRLKKGDQPTWYEVKSFMIKNGYLQVSLYSEESGKCVQYVHRVIAATFLKPPPGPEHQIDHLWGDKTDNRVANLRWVTPAENIASARTWQKQARADRAAYKAKQVNAQETYH